jgi:hypothetical protein
LLLRHSPSPLRPERIPEQLLAQLGYGPIKRNAVDKKSFQFNYLSR